MFNFQSWPKVIIALGIFMIAALWLDSQTSETKLIGGLYILISYFAYMGIKYFEERKNNKTYTCIFEKDVISSKDQEVVAHFEVRYEMPFPPYIGLEIAGYIGNEEDENYNFNEFYTGKVTKVIWKSHMFVCDVEPHKMTSKNSLEEVIIEHSRYAWKLRGLFLGLKDSTIKHIDKKLLELKDKEDNQRDFLLKIKDKLKN